MDNTLENHKYKTCGYGHPDCDRDGHYDEVFCSYNEEKIFCGDPCPADNYDPFFVDDSQQF